MSIFPNNIYKADKLSFTRHDFAVMLERLIDEGILDEVSNVVTACFNFKFSSLSRFVFTEDMIVFDREYKCVSAKCYNYDKAGWICDEFCVHVEDCVYANLDPSETVRSLKFYCIDDIEKYIRNVYAEAHIAVEALKNQRLIDEIEKL